MNKRLGAADIRIFIGILIGIVCVIGVVALLRFDTTGERGSGLGTDFEYSLEELSKIDPNLIIYEESSAPINTGFSLTHAVAVDEQGTIYVAGDNAVRMYDDSGEKLDEIALQGEPRCLAVYYEQNDDAKRWTIYIGMKNHVRIFQQGKLIKTWQSLGDNALLTSIAVSDEDVFVADAGNRIVVRFDKDGNIVNKIGEKDEDRNIPGFVIPSPYFDLAIGRDGHTLFLVILSIRGVSIPTI